MECVTENICIRLEWVRVCFVAAAAVREGVLLLQKFVVMRAGQHSASRLAEEGLMHDSCMLCSAVVSVVRHNGMGC